MPCSAKRAPGVSQLCDHQRVFQEAAKRGSYRVSVPHFDDLGIGRHDEIQRIVEAERFDGQAVEVVFDQQRLVGAQVIQQHLRDQK